MSKRLLLKAAIDGDLPEIKRLLLEGANPNATNRFGETVLMLAAANGDEESVKALLDGGADKNIKSKTGQTALDIAEETEQTGVAALLRHYIPEKREAK